MATNSSAPVANPAVVVMPLAVHLSKMSGGGLTYRIGDISVGIPRDSLATEEALEEYLISSSEFQGWVRQRFGGQIAHKVYVQRPRFRNASTNVKQVYLTFPASFDAVKFLDKEAAAQRAHNHIVTGVMQTFKLPDWAAEEYLSRTQTVLAELRRTVAAKEAARKASELRQTASPEALVGALAAAGISQKELLALLKAAKENS